MKYIQLLTAISEIEKWRISRTEMVILAPPNTLAKLLLEIGTADRWYDSSNKSFFQDILFVEDEQIKQVVVKSLISSHRVEVN